MRRLACLGLASLALVAAACGGDGKEAIPTPDCGDAGVAVTEGEIVKGATGTKGTPVDAAQAILGATLRPTDRLAPQGERDVRVIRDARNAAILRFRADGKGGWLLEGFTACLGTGIAGA